MPSDALLTTAEAAAQLRVSRMTIARWVKDGQLKAVKVGAQYRFRPEDIEAAIKPFDPEATS